MPGAHINDIPMTSAVIERSQIALDFSWDPEDGSYSYPDGTASGAPKAEAGVPITFTASVRPGTPIVAYEWNFGDGSTGFGPEVTHTFKIAAPQLRVSLCVTDDRNVRTCIGRQLNLS